MTLAGVGGAVPSLASEIAGRPMTGSWWGHPNGREIFRLSSELADHEDVLLMKLIESKVTFVHRSLWPAVLCAAIEPSRVAAATASLSPRARKLRDAVESEGALRLDSHAKETGEDLKVLKKAADELAAGALALSTQEHTEAGAHFTVLRSWQDWAAPAVLSAAKRIAFADALAAVEEACAGLRTPFRSAESANKPSRKFR